MAKAQVRVLPSARNTVMVVDDQSTGRAILEQVVRSLQNGHSVLCAVRFGNVLGSRGSVIPTFFRQIARCIRQGHLVSYQPTAGLPADYAAQPVKTDARFVLFAGRRNQCFLPDSQEATYHWLDAQRPGFHGLHVLDTYSHLDIFMGERAANDVFPIMLRELER